MRGSVDWQVMEIFKSVNAIGTSKHEAKIEAREAGAKTWEQTGKAIDIHGYKTLKDYPAITRDMFGYVKAEYGIKDILRIEGHQIQAWLMNKMENGGRSGDGIERATFNKYAAAMGKFERALNQYTASKGLTDKTFNFDLKDTRKYAASELGQVKDDSRAYANPTALVDAVPGRYNLLAKVIYESGARISEANHIKPNQLLGVKPDPITGEMKGWVHVHGKGGKPNDLGMKVSTYERLKSVIADKGVFHINQKNFREKLELAARATNQKYEGPHGLRWNYAASMHKELQNHGLSQLASLSELSRRLTHERSDISCRYLR